MTGESGSDIFYLEIFLNTIRKEEDIHDGVCGNLQGTFGPCAERDPAASEKREMSAGDIGGHFDMTGATISYHLKILKKADLVWETKVKNFVYYELNTTVVEELLLWLSDLKGGNSDER